MKQLNVNFPQKIAAFESVMEKEFPTKTSFYKRIFRGRGFEFDGYREYIEEDASLIDWKVSMRVKKLMIKQYVEERDLRIFFIIDVGDNMIFGSGNHLKNEISAEIVACLSHLVISSGDKVGFALFGDKISHIHSFLPGLKQFYVLTKNLKDPRNYGGRPDLEKTLDSLFPHLKNADAVFIISDFLKVNEKNLKILKKFGDKYEVIGIMVRDPIELSLPDIKREVVVEDIYTGEQVLMEPSLIKYEYKKYSLEQKRNVERIFKKTNSSLLSIYTDKDFISPLVQFLKSRIKTRRYVLPGVRR